MGARETRTTRLKGFRGALTRRTGWAHRLEVEKDVVVGYSPPYGLRIPCYDAGRERGVF